VFVPRRTPREYVTTEDEEEEDEEKEEGEGEEEERRRDEVTRTSSIVDVIRS